MQIGILKELHGDRRVALIPETAKQCIALGAVVCIESGAGIQAMIADEQYEAVGVQVIQSRKEVLENCQIILTVNKPADEDILASSPDTIFIGVFRPMDNRSSISDWKESGRTIFSLDLLPRTTRAQSMDILSSMATVSGYKAVLTAANLLPTFFPMFMTAAGTITPAKILILGAGVAGLQAIATARKLGAVVHVFDVRSAVKEEVMSLGGKFVEIPGAKDDQSAGGYAVEQTEEYLAKQRQAIHDQASKSNVIICTAQIPGRKAPELILEDTVKAMVTGAVIIDLAASSGGNCVLTEDNKTVVKHGVTIVGESNFPSTLPMDASKMFSKNMYNFLSLMIQNSGVHLNWEDDIILNTCISHQGVIQSPRLQS
jgi:NAD(P) transhydrogenase subunit alpha